MLNFLIKCFPLWAIVFAISAYLIPAPFSAQKTMIVPLLTIIMLAMGLTLSWQDFAKVLHRKKAVGLGIALQFSVMPLLALLISWLLHFDAQMTVGMVLVGSVAGGTSSNVMAYLAKGDVALSISMTAISTLLGVVMTPLLTELLAGQAVDVPMLSMLESLLKIVLLPVTLGIAANMLFHRQISKVQPLLPLISMLAILLIIAIVVALNVKNIVTIGPIVALAVVLHNGLGLGLGYGVAKLLGFEESIARTIAFEVGLQNSGLATALATKFFTATAAVAGTLFSVWHNISGSLLAGFWANRQGPSEKSANQSKQKTA
ncbi:Pantothenate precursors transporter PanS [Vibrio stylophorae]|uniref:Pantothenates transporter PanS n=1 Tax=Vibrio stylophorae TaxID=659351 RepID=A0ABM8ZUH6_9VIBR|nr:bile acid:sodium symporter family protein [Vibrio stylophorae]CAH0533963.1 Pantothenate precursors transporter PanS [Vibrio stylophorae]